MQRKKQIRKEMQRNLNRKKILQKTPRASIIIPAYNEEKTLQNIVDKVSKLRINKEIILIDDGSTDKTGNVMLRIAVSEGPYRVLFGEENRGKGFSIRQGIERAKGDIIIIQDADKEYDPKDIPRLIKPIIEGRAVVVYGSRFIDGYKHKKSLNYYGNRLVTWLTNTLYGSKLTDMETGYKAIWRPILEEINLTEDRFGIEPEITAKLLKIGVTIKEVPISYNPRTYAQGKKINWKDGLYAAWVLIKNRLWPDRLAYLILRTLRTGIVLDNVNFDGPVLDIGCGDKYFINGLQVKAIGLDRLYGDEITNKLQFKKETFDYVTMMAIMEHFENPKELLKECHRVLSEEGKLIITLPSKSTHSLIQLFWAGTHKRYYTTEQLERTLQPYFIIEKVVPFEFGLNTLYICKKVNENGFFA
jgi:glycosyltransferase involved in cell wall biosynthesis